MYFVYGLFKHGRFNDRFNGLFYIGQSTNLPQRILDHAKETHNPIKANIIKKYGFYCMVLWTCFTQEEANEKEIWAIKWVGKYCDKNGTLANLADGGHYPNNGLNTYEERRDAMLSRPYNEILLLLDEYTKSGLSKSKFCKNHNLKLQNFISWVRNYSDIPLRKSKKRLSESDIENICNLYNSGMRLVDISRQTSILPNTVARWLTKCGRIKPRTVYSKEERFQHLNNYYNGNITLWQYCLENNVSESSMLRWRSQYAIDFNGEI